MSDVLAVQERDWVVIRRMDGPPRLRRELGRILGPDWEADERGSTRVAHPAWDAALAVFRRYNMSVTLTAAEMGAAEGTGGGAGHPSPPPETDTWEERVMGADVRQQVVEDERAAEEEIASLQARIEELERKRDELRRFLTMYEHYAAAGNGASSEPTPAAARVTQTAVVD